MSSPYAAAEMLQQEIKDRCAAYTASGQKLIAENERLRSALKAVIGHWDEFGPEYGFAETIDRIARPALQPLT